MADRGFVLGLLGTKHAIKSHVSRCGSSVFNLLMRVAVPVAGSERAVANPLLLQVLRRFAKLRHARMPERVQSSFGNPQPFA
jgi:hypothetical protein